MSKKDNFHNCHEAEKLIMETTLRTLHTRESKWLNAHLASCSGCAAFRKRIENLGGAIQQYKKLEPDPGLVDRLSARLISVQHPQDSIFQKISLKISTFLEYRIPVYQVALASLILFTALLINRVPLPILSDSGSSSAGYDTTESVRQWHFIERQGTEKAIEADTILTRMIRSVL